MSKRLKNLIIILVVVIVTAGLGVGGYFLISNLSSTTIYNLQIFAVNNQGEKVKIKDAEVYLVSEGENSFDIAVDVSASNNNNGYYFISSNEDVAKVVASSDGYSVQYYKTGKATITAYSRATATVYDSFNVTVYSDFVADVVIDDEPSNVITIYGDGNTIIKNYEATGVLNGEACNNLQLRVVENYNKSVFNSISINTQDKTVSINTKLVTEDSLESFTVQSYYTDSNGVDHVEKNFEYQLNVIGYRIDDIQLLVSQTYQFDGQTYLYLSTDALKDVDKSDVFHLEGEEFIDNVYITKDVNTLFFKIRVVYSNKTCHDISTAAISSGSINGYVNPIGGSTRNMDYWSVSTSDNIYVDDNMAYDEIYFSYVDTVVNSRVEKYFSVTYLEPNANSSSKYYEFVNKELYQKRVLKDGSSYFEYIYWDTRFKRTDTITNRYGQIIGFVNGEPDCTIIYEELEN